MSPADVVLTEPARECVGLPPRAAFAERDGDFVDVEERMAPESWVAP